MVPAHHVTTLRLVGCPDPNPIHRRFFDPPRETLAGGSRCHRPPLRGGALLASCDAGSPRRTRRRRSASRFPAASTAAPCCCASTSCCSTRGSRPRDSRRSRSRWTGRGTTRARRASSCGAADLEMLGETIDVPSSALDPLRAVAVIEDYKPLDVECATVNLALLAGIRERYPELAAARGRRRRRREPQGLSDRGEPRAHDPQRRQQSHAVPGRAGESIPSSTRSRTRAGYSRGCVRGYACARALRFVDFSPYTRPSVIAVAEAIPFAALTRGIHRAAVRAEGRDRGAWRPRRARRRHAGLPEAPLPARFRVAGRGDAPVRAGRSALPPTLRDAARRGRVIASDCRRRIRALRQPKPAVDPWRAHGTLVEEERRPGGRVERALTIFLAGSECPFTCSFCDLWRWTIDGPTPRGALPRQIEDAIVAADAPRGDRIKLYNASNFFDRRAVPPEDVPSIAALCAPFGGVTVESHANTIGDATLRFAELLDGRLEVAMGLETIHPVATRHLNKRLDLDRFERAARFLAAERHRPARVRAAWRAVRSRRRSRRLDGAQRASTRRTSARPSCAIIPVRGGNGELERLAALGHFTAADTRTAGVRPRRLPWRVGVHGVHGRSLGPGASPGV